MPTALGTIASNRTAAAGGGLPVTTGLAAWYDADDAATITASAGAVSQWNDKSGNLRHATNAGANKPVTGTRTIGGKNVLEFTTDQLDSPNYTQTQPVTAIAAIQADTAAGTRFIIGHVGGGNPSLLYSNNQYNLYAGVFLVGGTTNTAAHVMSGLFNGASSEIWVDGVSVVAGNPGNTGWGGVPIRLGSPDWDGLIAEVAVYNRALSTVERQQVESYLKTKWGTP